MVPSSALEVKSIVINSVKRDKSSGIRPCTPISLSCKATTVLAVAASQRRVLLLGSSQPQITLFHLHSWSGVPHVPPRGEGNGIGSHNEAKAYRCRSDLSSSSSNDATTGVSSTLFLALSSSINHARARPSGVVSVMFGYTNIRPVNVMRLMYSTMD
jgi:hypothetical protein